MKMSAFTINFYYSTYKGTLMREFAYCVFFFFLTFFYFQYSDNIVKTLEGKSQYLATEVTRKNGRKKEEGKD